jgi:hypothetical protein
MPALPAAVQPVMQEVGSAVCQQAVTLHLSEADASTHLAPLDGLTGQLIHLACRAHLQEQNSMKASAEHQSIGQERNGWHTPGGPTQDVPSGREEAPLQD